MDGHNASSRYNADEVGRPSQFNISRWRRSTDKRSATWASSNSPSMSIINRVRFGARVRTRINSDIMRRYRFEHAFGTESWPHETGKLVISIPKERMCRPRSGRSERDRIRRERLRWQREMGISRYSRTWAGTRHALHTRQLAASVLRSAVSFRGSSLAQAMIMSISSSGSGKGRAISVNDDA